MSLTALWPRAATTTTGAPSQRPGGGGTSTTAAQAAEEARAVVGDVIDFSLTPDGWEGAFGFVTMKLHKGAFDGKDLYFVRTDASDESFAQAEELVYVPKLASLTGDGLSAAAYTSSKTPPTTSPPCSPPNRAETITRRHGACTGSRGRPNRACCAPRRRSWTPSGPAR